MNDILEKYVSISTDNNFIIINSTDFTKGDIINFKFEINNIYNTYNNNTCDGELKYELYDNIDLININNYKYCSLAII